MPSNDFCLLFAYPVGMCGLWHRSTREARLVAPAGDCHRFEAYGRGPMGGQCRFLGGTSRWVPAERASSRERCMHCIDGCRRKGIGGDCSLLRLRPAPHADG